MNKIKICIILRDIFKIKGLESTHTNFKLQLLLIIIFNLITINTYAKTQNRIVNTPELCLPKNLESIYRKALSLPQNRLKYKDQTGFDKIGYYNKFYKYSDRNIILKSSDNKNPKLIKESAESFEKVIQIQLKSMESCSNKSIVYDKSVYTTFLICDGNVIGYLPGNIGPAVEANPENRHPNKERQTKGDNGDKLTPEGEFMLSDAPESQYSDAIRYSSTINSDCDPKVNCGINMLIHGPKKTEVASQKYNFTTRVTDGCVGHNSHSMKILRKFLAPNFSQVPFYICKYNSDFENRYHVSLDTPNEYSEYSREPLDTSQATIVVNEESFTK